MTAASYDQWRANAQARDDQTGAAGWKADDRTDLFDYRVIRRRRDELVELRAECDVPRLLYYLNEGLHGNMGGMGSSRLYGHAAFGTKDLVSEYIEELAGALEQLADADDDALPFDRKLAFFRQARQAFGNCALMLSGAGSLGPFHLGRREGAGRTGPVARRHLGRERRGPRRRGGLYAGRRGAAGAVRGGHAARSVPAAPRRAGVPAQAGDAGRPAARGRGTRSGHDLRRGARSVRARPEHLRRPGRGTAAVAHPERHHVAERVDPRSGHGDVRDPRRLPAGDPRGPRRGRHAAAVRALAQVGRRLGHRRHAHRAPRARLRLQLLHREPGETRS